MYKQKSTSHVFPSKVLDLGMQVFLLLHYRKDKYLYKKVKEYLS